jgi:hypothetical protein
MEGHNVLYGILVFSTIVKYQTHLKYEAFMKCNELFWQSAMFIWNRNPNILEKDDGGKGSC